MMNEVPIEAQDFSTLTDSSLSLLAKLNHGLSSKSADDSSKSVPDILIPKFDQFPALPYSCNSIFQASKSESNLELIDSEISYVNEDPWHKANCFELDRIRACLFFHIAAALLPDKTISIEA